MRLNHSSGLSAALNANFKNQRAYNKTLHKLSTGLRINGASDDAAGLAISENLRTQVRGSSQARKNALDGISMLNIAEGGLNEVHAMLQRGRELSLQASTETLTDSERVYINKEVSSLIEEIDRLSETTQFNGIKVLTGGVNQDDATSVVDQLKDSWLAVTEQLVADQYGLVAEGEPLEIKTESGGAGGIAAYVQYSYGADGKAENMSLNIDVDDFLPTVNGTNGGTAPLYSDRIIAHEMVHAVMASTMDTTNLPTWFKEGTAEYIHGADERLKSDLNSNTAQELVDMIVGGGWASDSAHYSGAYAAIKYFDSQIDAGDFKSFMTSLDDTNNNGDLDPSVDSATPFLTTAAFLADFQVNGAAFIMGLNLNDADTGSIGGGDAQTVVAATMDSVDSPSSNFVEDYSGAADSMILHIGANATDSDELELEYGSVNSGSIGIADIDVSSVKGAQGAITAFDTAIEQGSSVRGDTGAYTNRLEHTVNNLLTSEINQQAAESQIRDVDFAEMASEMTRQQILSQSSLSMISQANSQRQQILSLIG